MNQLPHVKNPANQFLFQYPAGGNTSTGWFDGFAKLQKLPNVGLLVLSGHQIAINQFSHNQ
ncbi:hypothetical protein [Spirosoma foliorum]|uniref:Uncharacterized protein n=1 Tax=Spirosoma foliorum TaxID=2710596 RepID=A0A7G5GNA8_9BACT|nr:hypothetical protein [Spirosoma foliorum]QMW00350.1 hypothetical protein H3H32_20270 [Spirosoma foliorum]